MTLGDVTASAGFTELLAKLGDLTASTIHEVAGEASALPPQIRPVIDGVELCGPAVTVLNPPRDNLWIHRAVYAAPPGSVLVASFSGEYEAGYWGEILAVAAIERGLAGVVLDGCARDKRELEKLGFPVFARGLCVRGTRKSPGVFGGVDVPVSIGTSRVEPGDLVRGDDDGVVVVRRSHLEEVVAAGIARVRREEDVLVGLRVGGSSLDLLGLERGGTRASKEQASS